MQLLKPYQFVPNSEGELSYIGIKLKELADSNPALYDILTDFNRVQFIDEFGFCVNEQGDWFSFKRTEGIDIVELRGSSLLAAEKEAWNPVAHAQELDWFFITDKFQFFHSVDKVKGHPIYPLCEIVERFIEQTQNYKELVIKLGDLGLRGERGQKSFSHKGMLVEYDFTVSSLTSPHFTGTWVGFRMNGISRPFEKFSADFYKVVLNSAAVDIAVFDTDHRYMLVNEFAIKNREIRNWMIGRTDFDYCEFRNVDDTMARFRHVAFEESKEQKKMIELEETMTDAQGNKHYFLKRFKPIVIENEVRYMMGFGMDITPLKMAQERFRESEERYRELFESSVDIIQSVDNQGKFIFANRAWHRLFEFDEHEMLAINLFDIIAEDSLPHCLDMFAEVLQGVSHTDIHAVFKNKSGRRIVLEGNIVPRMVEGKVVATHAFFRDVTDREQKDEQLRASLVEKEALLGEIHHRVKNNLAVVYSLMELQAMQEKNAEIAFAYRESQSRIKAMALVHEMLYQDHTFGSVDLFAYLRGLSEHLRSLLAVDKNVELTFNGHEARIMMTHAVTCGLFANEVLTNAYKYAVPVAENPKIEINVEASEEDVLIEISDNGPGLPPGFDAAKSNSLGFKLMKTFTSQLKGELSVQTENGLFYQLKFKR
jgi:PAS domain S-box-containing protein